MLILCLIVVLFKLLKIWKNEFYCIRLFFSLMYKYDVLVQNNAWIKAFKELKAFDVLKALYVAKNMLHRNPIHFPFIKIM